MFGCIGKEREGSTWRKQKQGRNSWKQNVCSQCLLLGHPVGSAKAIVTVMAVANRGSAIVFNDTVLLILEPTPRADARLLDSQHAVPWIRLLNRASVMLLNASEVIASCPKCSPIHHVEIRSRDIKTIVCNIIVCIYICLVLHANRLDVVAAWIEPKSLYIQMLTADEASHNVDDDDA